MGSTNPHTSSDVSSNEVHNLYMTQLTVKYMVSTEQDTYKSQDKSSTNLGLLL